MYVPHLNQLFCHFDERRFYILCGPGRGFEERHAQFASQILTFLLRYHSVGPIALVADQQFASVCAGVFIYLDKPFADMVETFLHKCRRKGS